MQSISSYINPNTRGLTSNYKNTAIKDKETYNEAMSQHLLNPVEDLVQVLKTPIKLAKSSSLSRQNNSVNIAEGQRIRVNGGHVLTATAHGVEVSGGDNLLQKARSSIHPPVYSPDTSVQRSPQMSLSPQEYLRSEL